MRRSGLRVSDPMRCPSVVDAVGTLPPSATVFWCERTSAVPRARCGRWQHDFRILLVAGGGTVALAHCDAERWADASVAAEPELGLAAARVFVSEHESAQEHSGAGCLLVLRAATRAVKRAWVSDSLLAHRCARTLASDAQLQARAGAGARRGWACTGESRLIVRD